MRARIYNAHRVSQRILQNEKEKREKIFSNTNISDLLLMRTKLLIEYIDHFQIHYIYLNLYTRFLSLERNEFNHFISPLLLSNFILRSFSHNSFPSSIHSKNSSPRTKQILFSFFHFHNLTPPRTQTCKLY